jgi:hypothetical protein
MSSTLIDNGNLESYQLAPGAKLQYLQDGTITGSARYTARLGSAGSGIAIGTAHPYNSLALCAESEVTYNESEAEDFSNFVGVWSSAVQKVTSVSSVSAVPITQCPNWIGTDGPEGALVDFALFSGDGQFNGFPGTAAGTGPGKTGYPSSTGVAYPSGDPYRLGGVSAYYQGAFTVRISYSTTDSSTVTAAVAKIGSVLMSLVAGMISYSFDYYAFICPSVTYEETPFGVSGLAQWKIEEEYLFLPDPGVDPAVYA